MYISRCLARQLLYNFSWEGIFVSLEENFDCIEREKGGKEIKGNKKKKGRVVALNDLGILSSPERFSPRHRFHAAKRKRTPSRAGLASGKRITSRRGCRSRR